MTNHQGEMMRPPIFYEVWGRRPVRKGRKQKPSELFDGFSEDLWQAAVKLAYRLAAKGWSDVMVREVTITHELRIKGRV